MIDSPGFRKELAMTSSDYQSLSQHRGSLHLNLIWPRLTMLISGQFLNHHSSIFWKKRVFFSWKCSNASLMICHDQVEVVTHNKVCHGAVADIPPALARFLGDVSGLAEFVDNKVMFCRHAACWSLDLRNNTWTRAASLHVSYCYDKLYFSFISDS